jgi:hypothetical protein
MKPGNRMYAYPIQNNMSTWDGNVEASTMQLRRKYLDRHGRPLTIPSYLLPPIPQEVVFDPSLRRAGGVVAEAQEGASD